MKAVERRKARELRAQGCSINEICRQVNASKGSISVWVRDVPLTPDYIERLQERVIIGNAIGRERAGISLSDNRRKRWEQFRALAEEEYKTLCKNPDFMFGLALYVGEGGKRDDYSVNIANADFRVIIKAIDFYQLIGIDKDKITFRIHSHEGNNKKDIIRYWCEHLPLKPEQCKGVTYSISRQSEMKKGNILPYGTCHLRHYNTLIKQKLLRWIELSLQ